MQKNENKLMAENTSKEISHHANELESAVHKTAHIPAWVIAKLERSSTDLSDVTHYLDGDPKFAQGGGIVNLDKIKNNIGEVLYKFIGSLNKEQAERMLTDLKAEIEFELKTQSTSARYSRLIDEQNLLLYRLGRDNEMKMAQGGNVAKFSVGDKVVWTYEGWDKEAKKDKEVKKYGQIKSVWFNRNEESPLFHYDVIFSDGTNEQSFLDRSDERAKKFFGNDISELSKVGMAQGGGIDKNLPVGQRVSSEKINKFIDYVYGFYGKGGIYARDFNGGLTKAQITKGVNEYIEELDQEKTWGGGDSLDRERVREYLESKKYAQGGEIDEDEKYELAEKLEQDVTSYIADKKGISEDEAMAIIQDQNGREYFADTISFTKDVKSKWSTIVQNLGDEFISINDDEDFSYENGGEIEGEGVNLFEDEDNIPPKVMAILDKYSYAFMDGEFEELHKCRKKLEKIGYTMDIGMGGEAMNLRKIGQKPKYANGGGVDEELVFDSKFEKYVAKDLMKLMHITYKQADEIVNTRLALITMNMLAKSDVYFHYYKNKSLDVAKKIVEMSKEKVNEVNNPKIKSVSINNKIKDYYIEFLNRNKNYKKDKKYFDSIAKAKKWGMDNLNNFNEDMIFRSPDNSLIGDNNLELVNFDLNKLNGYEKIMYNAQKEGVTKADILQNLINDSNRNSFKLSPELSKIAKSQKSNEEKKYSDGGSTENEEDSVVEFRIYKDGKFAGTKKELWSKFKERKGRLIDPTDYFRDEDYTIPYFKFEPFDDNKNMREYFVMEWDYKNEAGLDYPIEVWVAPHYVSDWMEKGGSVDDIDMNEVEKSAIFYTDETRWSTKPTIAKFEKELAENKELLNKLERKEISPAKIVGGGYKSSAIARKIAFKYLKEKVLISERAIEILKERGQTFATGGGVESEKLIENMSIHDIVFDITKALKNKTFNSKNGTYYFNIDSRSGSSITWNQIYGEKWSIRFERYRTPHSVYISDSKGIFNMKVKNIDEVLSFIKNNDNIKPITYMDGFKEKDIKDAMKSAYKSVGEKWNDKLDSMEYGGTTPKQQKKIGKVMHEFKEGDLKTSAGTKVTNPKQAVAIALSEAGVPKKGWGHKKSLRK